jgi:hypothetical protein
MKSSDKHCYGGQIRTLNNIAVPVNNCAAGAQMNNAEELSDSSENSMEEEKQV